MDEQLMLFVSKSVTDLAGAHSSMICCNNWLSTYPNTFHSTPLSLNETNKKTSIAKKEMKNEIIDF